MKIPIKGTDQYLTISPRDAKLFKDIVLEMKSATTRVHYYPVVRNKKRGSIVYAHQIVMGSPPEGLIIDHINGDVLDARRQNLRFITHGTNTASRHKSTGKVPYLGVWQRKNGTYRCGVQKDGYKMMGSSYTTSEEASQARDLLALEAYEENAKLNHPELLGQYLKAMEIAGIKLSIKICNKCMVIRSKSEFYTRIYRRKNKPPTKGPDYICKSCKNELNVINQRARKLKKKLDKV